MIVRDHGRRGPRIAIRADIAQVSRSAGAVARSRPGIREQSLEWMPRRGNKFNSEFTMQNCEIICHSEEHSDEESINQQYLFFMCSPGSAAGVASSMRAGPGARSATLASALPHQRNSRNVGHACRNVMLSEADRRTQRVQRPLADYALQGGERQTKCNQESVYVYLIQILRRSAPQNDKTGRTEIRTTRWDRTISLFANSAADWNKQLAATRKGGRKRCSGRPRLAELNTGFSRASRSPALRRLAKLAPRASAREHLRHLYQNQATANYKTAEREKPARNNRPQTTIPYQSSCAITPPADC